MEPRIFKLFTIRWRLIGAAAVILVLSVFVKWPLIIQAPCYFSAVEEWELVQSNPSRLLSVLRDNARMKTPLYTLLQYARQDFIQFSMDPDLTSGRSVEKDQPIGEIVSSESQILFANLQGQLNRARANLQMLRTGQKEAVQKEAVEALNYAKTQLDVFLPQYERNRKLHQQKLISDEEWELSVKTEELLRRNIQVQQAKLQVVQSGEKQETVRMTEEDIDRLESQLRQLQRKISLGQIRTPIAGVFSNASQDSVLCRVSRLDSVACTLMLRSDQIPFVRPGQTVVVRDPEAGFRKTGTVFTIDQKCSSVSGRSVFFLTAVVDNAGGRILSGMIGRAAVFTDRASLAERVRRAWIRRAGQIYL
jgi:hypothetical protein